MDATAILIGFTVGGGVGVVAGVLATASRVLELRADYDAACEKASKWINRVRDKNREIAALAELVAAHEADEERRLAPLKAANAKRHQAKLDRDAANAARQEALHAEIREMIGEMA